jgi:putative ABC transport system permease protein
MRGTLRVAVRLDASRADDFYAATKKTPKISTVSLRERSIRNFRDSTGAVVLLLAGIYVAFSITIAIGVVYNNLRIGFQERSLELAMLRVLGFTPYEAARIFFSEILVQVGAAIPLGLVAGYFLVRLLLLAFQTEMFEIPPASPRVPISGRLRWSAGRPS